MKSRYNKTILATLCNLAIIRPVLGQAGRWMKLMTSISVLSLLAITAKANLIQNGSFEQSNPVLTVDGIYQFVGATSWSSGPDYFFRGAVGGAWPAPQDGQQFVDFVGGSTIWQNVNIPMAGAYQVTWYDNGLNQSPYAYNMYIGNSLVWSGLQFFSGTGSPTWTARSLTVNLVAGINTLQFTGDINHSYHFLLDNVVLQPLASVPDTGGTLTLLGLGCAAISLFAKRSFNLQFV